MIEAQLIGTLSNGGEVYEVNAPLDVQVEAFERKKINAPYLASPDQIAQMRLEGVHSNWSRTCYAPLKIKDKPTIVTANSPWLANKYFARQVVKVHKNGEYPTMPKWFYEMLEQEAKDQERLPPEDKSVHIMQGRPDSDNLITLTPESDDARFLIKRFTKKYFEENSHDTIPFYDLPNNIPKGKTTVNYLWFLSPQNGSGLSAGDRDLGDDGRASGVLNKNAEGASQNFEYSLTNIRDSVIRAIPLVFRLKGIPALSEMVKTDLEQEVLKGLRDQ